MDAILATTAELNAVLPQTTEEEYDNIANQVLSALRKLQAPDDATTLQLLQTIDPATSTIPYVLLLSHLIDTSVKAHKSSRSLPVDLLPEGKLWPFIANALLNFDRIQVRYVGQQFVKIVDAVFSGAEQTSNYVPAIQLLQHTILSLDPTSSTLSRTHFYYIRLCLYARAYAEALPILDLPIYHVPASESVKALEKRLGNYLCSQSESSVAYINSMSGLSGKITTRVYLEYYFMGALCYIAMHEWRKAQNFLEVILVAPTHQNAASLIMLEAYRKWVLVGLIVDGTMPSIPRAVNGNAIKHIRCLAKPYECVADAFKTNKMDVLVAEVQEGNEIWQPEGNYGLMLQVFAAFRRFAVIRLGKTFAALPVEDVAKHTSPEPENVQETLAYVQNLITTGALQAQIVPSQKGGLGTVRFLPPSAAHKSEQQVELELARKTVELKTLLRHISNYDHQIEVNKDYLEYLVKAKKARDQDKKNAAAGGGSGFPIGRPPLLDSHDEEMMEEPW